ncbi:hypothetical protein KAR91_63120, partial [Candidatus Pacearchaeota archaeon]|nr:hypothetical protein [Candidatus Pacearchaeota archaeon]
MAIPKNEVASELPTVRTGVGEAAADRSDLYCHRVEKKTGVTPSTALLQYVPGRDVQGPGTLINGGDLKKKERIIIWNQALSRVYFQGWISGRSDQHTQQTNLWDCVDDTLPMHDVYVRGQYIADTLIDTSPAERELRFSAAKECIFNEGGYWSCTGITIDNGVDTPEVWPVFLPTPILGKAYETPDQDYSGDPPTDGSASPWTPRRILKYLTLVMHYKDITGQDRLVGMIGDANNAISRANVLLDQATIAGLDGKDPAISAVDPLDRMCQQLVCQADTVLAAIDKATKVAGTHTIATSYATAGLALDPPEFLTNIIFKPIGYSGIADPASRKNLNLQFDGPVNTDEGYMFDFSLNEDATNTSQIVFCEGQVVRVETELEWDGSYTTSTIVPAWSAAEELSFLRCIFGNANLGLLNQFEGDFAIRPIETGVPSANANDYESCNGNNGTTLAYPGSPEAVTVARQSYPTVFAAFTIKPQGNLADALDYPTDSNGHLDHSRSIYPKQLQFFTWQANQLNDSQLKSDLPVRLSILGSNGIYIDVPKDTAIRNTARGDSMTPGGDGDNLIWLDGCGEGVDGTLSCIYNASLYNISDIKYIRTTLKKFKLNCAVPTDYRVQGLATASTPDWLSDDYETFFNGSVPAPIRYIYKPTSFREYLQYNSTPAVNTKYFGGVDGTDEIAAPLTRTLPPGSEDTNAEYAAQRELSRIRNQIKNSSWIQKGIHMEFDSGDWLGQIYVYQDHTTPENYDVNGAIGTVKWDFLAQTTIVGNVFS